MKNWSLLFSIWLSLSAAAAPTELWLRLGEGRKLPAPAGAEVRVGSRGVIRVIDGEQAVRVIGLKTGMTTLVIGAKSYTVRVTAAAQTEFRLALRQALAPMMGLQLSAADSSLEITGTLLRFSDWLKLAEVARRHHGAYVFRAQALADVAATALGHFHALARKRGFPILRFTASPEFTAILPKAAQGLKAAVERELAPFGIRVEMSESDLALQPLVRTHVILAEVTRGFSRQFGVAWPSEYQANLLPRLGTGGSDPEQNLMVKLKALEAHGQAQILASPNLLCRSGSEARFHAGGEFPVRITSRREQNVVWKSHGVILKVKPRADFQGAISLEIETEVSTLDMAHAVDGVPALKTNSVKSHFDLPGKRTIALSGLLRRESGEGKEGLPFLTDLPVLGPLFSSRNFQTQRSELVIFVTPEIHSPESDDKIEMPEGWVQDDE